MARAYQPDALARRRLRPYRPGRLARWLLRRVGDVAVAIVGPEERPADRVYAETRGTDPEGNNFDIAEGGFDREIAPEKRAKAPVSA